MIPALGLASSLLTSRLVYLITTQLNLHDVGSICPLFYFQFIISDYSKRIALFEKFAEFIWI